ncbi:hypothetical protein M9H77_01768 [Catharanthus roseus]|uniref:Uncharacterized protein n=1 Tax=Catharanthus roseus TaxID=4058 RepID=A0ACC0C6K0_CATRO|nr:hypothetical protein M9H77_01768 [Catharanthus roseus]
MGEGDRHELLGKGAEDATVAENVIGDGNCSYRVVADFVFSDEHQWPKVHRGMLYELELSKNLYVNLMGSEERVNELVHRINWLVMDLRRMRIEERHFIQLQLNDMCLIPPSHVQWIHHRSEWVSNWADSYQHRIADWNARVSRNRK